MAAYFARRLLLIIPTFIGITFVLFLLTRLVPGGPIEQAINATLFRAEGSAAGGGPRAAGQRTTNLSDQQLAGLKAFYGLDKPLLPAYVTWLGRVVRLDLGKSTRYGDPVLPAIMERVPVSLWFGLFSLLAAYLVSIPLGIAKALRHRRPFDNVSSTLVFVGYALPGYVVGIILLSAFAFQLRWLPLGGMQSDLYETMDLGARIVDRVSHLVLPLCAYVIGDFAMLTMMTKNNLMEQMASDYVRTAVAKGLPFRAAMWRHALRNSLIPVASGFGGIVTVFFAGSFLIENIFNIRGMGMLGYTALMDHDYPVVLGVVAVTSIASLVGNILGDFFVALVDPRVRFGERA
ncbi:MAG TPA: ABC transporter permease subunit [Spirochaetia bacterium]|nr:ABC transporter permease subunit [Spirochaetia bacterium]